MNDFKVDLFPLFSLSLCHTTHTLYQKVKLTKPNLFFLGKEDSYLKKKKIKIKKANEQY